MIPTENQCHYCPQHQIKYNRVCLHKSCKGSFQLYCNLCKQESHKDHLQLTLSSDEVKKKIQEFQQHGKFQTLLLQQSLSTLIKRVSFIQGVQTLVAQRETQLFLHLHRIYQILKVSSQSSEKITCISIYQAEIMNLMRLKPKVKYDLEKQCFVNQVSFDSELELEEQLAESRDNLAEIRDYAMKMYETLTDETEQFSEIHQDQQHQATKINQHRNIYLKKITKQITKYALNCQQQIQTKLGILSKIKQSIHSQQISVKLKNTKQTTLSTKSNQTPEQNHQNILQEIQIYKEQLNVVNFSYQTLQKKLKDLEEEFYELQEERNDLLQEVSVSRTKLHQLQKSCDKASYQHRNRAFRVQQISSLCQTLREQMQGVKIDLTRVQDQMKEEVQTQIQQYIQFNRKENQKLIITLQDLLNCPKSEILKKIQEIKLETNSLNENVQSYQLKIQLFERNKLEQDEKMQRLNIKFTQNNEKNLKHQQQLTTIKTKFQKRIEILSKDLEKNKQFIDLNAKEITRLQALNLKVKTEMYLKNSTIYRLTNRQRYEEEVLIQKKRQRKLSLGSQRQSLQAELKSLKCRMDSLGQCNKEQYGKTLESINKCRCLQEQLSKVNEQAQQYIEMIKDLQFEISKLKKSQETLKQSFYILKEYASRLQKQKQGQLLINLRKDQQIRIYEVQIRELIVGNKTNFDSIKEDSSMKLPRPPCLYNPQSSKINKNQPQEHRLVKSKMKRSNTLLDEFPEKELKREEEMNIDNQRIQKYMNNDNSPLKRRNTLNHNNQNKGTVNRKEQNKLNNKKEEAKGKQTGTQRQAILDKVMDRLNTPRWHLRTNEENQRCSSLTRSRKTRLVNF